MLPSEIKFCRLPIQHEYVTYHFFYIEFRQVRITEQERIIGELGRGLQQAGIKGDRRLVEHQKKYEQRIQFLMNKLRDAELNETPDERIRYLIGKRNNNPGHI